MPTAISPTPTRVNHVRKLVEASAAWTRKLAGMGLVQAYRGRLKGPRGPRPGAALRG